MSMTELRSDWLIGYYVLGRDKFCTKTISINNFSSERVVWEMKAPGNGAPGYVSNTRKSVSSDIQTLRSGLKKRGAAEFFFNQLRSVWIFDETLFRVFDVASQSINNS